MMHIEEQKRRPAIQVYHVIMLNPEGENRLPQTHDGGDLLTGHVPVSHCML